MPLLDAVRPRPARRRALPALGLCAVLALSALPLAGCSFFEAPSQLRGNKVDPDSLKELVIGTSTTADARSLLGSPTAHAMFDDNTWLYISEVTRTRIGRLPGVEHQNVVVLTFDDNGVLRKISKLDQADALPVAMNSKTTPAPGTSTSFMQQLLGNVGRYNAGGGLSDTGNISGGAPSP